MVTCSASRVLLALRCSSSWRVPCWPPVAGYSSEMTGSATPRPRGREAPAPRRPPRPPSRARGRDVRLGRGRRDGVACRSRVASGIPSSGDAACAAGSSRRPAARAPIRLSDRRTHPESPSSPRSSTSSSGPSRSSLDHSSVVSAISSCRHVESATRGRRRAGERPSGSRAPPLAASRGAARLARSDGREEAFQPTMEDRPGSDRATYPVRAAAETVICPDRAARTAR